MSEISSFILKCKWEDRYFICNRNANFFGDPVKPTKYIQWWEIPMNHLIWLCCSSDVQIIEEIPDCSNRFLKDQKYLNEIKEYYKKIDEDVDENEKICNIVLFSKYRELKERMNCRMGEIERLSSKIRRVDTKLKIYRMMMTQYRSWLDIPRYKLPTFEKSGIRNEMVYAFILDHKNEVKKYLEEGCIPVKNEDFYCITWEKIKTN